MGNSYITNPSAQQGEPEHRKGAVRPADIPANSERIIDDDLVEEGPTEIPPHAQPVRKNGVAKPSADDTVITPPRKI